MSIRIVCPGCGKAIKASDKYAGQSAKCPACSSTINVPAFDATPVPTAFVASPPPVDDRPCPFCAEPIKASAIKCRFCGEFLDGRTRQSVADSTPTPVNAVESDLLSCRPVMFRNRPVGFSILCFLLFFGTVAGLFAENEGSDFGWTIAGIAGVIFAIWYFRVSTTRLIVTNRRTILRRGILSKYTREVRHSDVRLLEVKQNIFARMFGVGSLSIASAGHGEVEIFVDGIQNPHQVKDTIDGYRA